MGPMLDCDVHTHCLLPLFLPYIEQPQSVLLSVLAACIFLGLQWSQRMGVSPQKYRSLFLSVLHIPQQEAGFTEPSCTCPTFLPLLAVGPLVSIGSILLP